jgi:hypothetical protein
MRWLAHAAIIAAFLTNKITWGSNEVLEDSTSGPLTRATSGGEGI